MSEDYICDICGTAIRKTSGFAYTTTAVCNSLGYWRRCFERNPEIYGDDGSMVAASVMMAIGHATPWIVCEPCSSLVDTDPDQAKQYAASGTAPPGCGPADQNDATLTAAGAWSLMYDEWPVSVQVGTRSITHDPSAGDRCVFCRRILSGEDKLGVISESMYKVLVEKGNRFLRIPDPKEAQMLGGEPRWIACLTCLSRAHMDFAASGIETTSRKKRPWWRPW